MSDKQAQADVLRYLKELVSASSLDIEFIWVAGHQDDKRPWHELTLMERLNVVADRLAKKVLIASLESDSFIDSRFPFERMRIEIDGEKVTGPVRAALELSWGTKEARELYHSKGILHREHFHLVWWDGCALAIPRFPKMFQAFVTKQTSKFCGTNRQLSRIDATVENVCPSCGQPDESSKHITRCSDEGRVELWTRSVRDLTEWVAETTSHLHLRDMLSSYLLARDGACMTDFAPAWDEELTRLAEQHDLIGWDNFVEGRISAAYLEVVAPCFPSRGKYNPTRWCTELVSRLMQMTHKQWLFRNHHVHFKKLDGLTVKQHEEIFRLVEQLLDIDPSDLLTRHRHLLEETDFEELGEGPAVHRQVWINSMESAIAAADHVRAGRPVWGDLGSFADTSTSVEAASPTDENLV